MACTTATNDAQPDVTVVAVAVYVKHSKRARERTQSGTPVPPSDRDYQAATELSDSFPTVPIGQELRACFGERQASWHEIGDKTALSTALEVVAARIPHDRVRLALVADGSEWIWDLFHTHFPEGEEILDYYHCADRVYETARAQYGEGTLEAQEWAEATLTRLSLNELGAVVGGLLRMTPRTREAEDSSRRLSIYLTGQRERVGYRELRQRGLPRGSGGVESANKLICHVRLKRSGAWWLEANGNAMLRIRCAMYNGTFERIFTDYMATHRVEKPSP